MSESAFMDEIRDNVTIVNCMTPRLLDPDLSEMLTHHLCRLLDSGTDTLLINLTGVERLSSIFIRSFIAAGKKARERSASMSFCCVSPVISEVFSITGLDQLYPIFKDESLALAEIGAPAP